MKQSKLDLQARASVRQKQYAKLSVSEKIGKLDAKLGVGKGAIKQRQKLEVTK